MVLAATALVAAACSGSATPTTTAAEPAASVDATTSSSGSVSVGPTTLGTTVPTSDAPVFGACADVPVSQPLAESDRIALTRIHEADGLTIDAAFYPHPDYQGNPWSQWGEGVVAPNGRYYSAIGDHRGADGNSYIYEYDPASNELVLLTDVISVVDHTAGAWGYGKVHAQMALGPCGEVFYATYWGSRRGLTYGNGYEGDILFHIDTAARTVVNHGVPAERQGLPTMASAPEHGLIYTIGVDPDTDAGTFMAIDVASGETVFSAPSDAGFRSIGVDGHGAAYFTGTAGELAIYDPDTNAIVDSHSLPGRFIRAAATRADGAVIGVTQRPNTFFTVDAEGITLLHEAGGYTTSVAYLTAADEFFYLPGAHGNSSESGAVLRAVDAVTGEERDVIALADIVSEQLGVILGGTYNVVLDETANRLYVGINVDPDGQGNGFGDVALLVIGLP